MLNGESLSKILGEFAEKELDAVLLPKFKLAYEKAMGDILKALGMEAAFKGGFDNMTDPALGKPYINEVRHKSFIEVTEEGTEAAAASVVEVIDFSGGPLFVADNPFFFLIRDDRNGTILFMGKVANPGID